MRDMKGTHIRRQQHSSRGLVISILVIFIAADIILVALALGWGRNDVQVAEPHSSTRADVPAADAEHFSNETESRREMDPPRTAPRRLSVVSDTVAWRSEEGSCSGRSSLELTIDAGETWGAAYPSTDGLGRPLWVSGADYASVQSVIASGEACEPGGVRTFNSGASWTEDAQVVTNSVFVDPNDSSALVWGGQAIQGPCGDMIHVAVTSDVASVVCGDGSIWSVPSGTTEWAQDPVRGAVAVAGSDGRRVAAVDSSDCEGLGLVEFDAESVEFLTCAPVASVGAATLDLAGNTLWLWVEDQLLISRDVGRSFD